MLITDIEMIEEIGEYKAKVKRVRDPRNTTITNSYGMYEAHLAYAQSFKHDERLSDSKYRKLISNVNKKIAEELLVIGQIRLPAGMGAIKIEGKENKPKIVDGKLVYNAPVDWDRTLELWAQDPHSKVAKTLVRIAPGIMYKFVYDVKSLKLKNRKYIGLSITRSLKQALKDKIKNKKPFGFILRNYGS